MIKSNRFRGIKWIALILASVTIALVSGKTFFNRANAATSNTVCHFAITSPYGIDGYPIDQIGVGGFLDWGAIPPAQLPANIDHVKVLRVRFDLYDDMFNALTTTVAINPPGSVWIVGNEPDTFHSNQDSLTPAEYAIFYYNVATKIRSLDPTAKVAFGPIVQPSPLRIAYLTDVLNRLDNTDLAGSRQAALDLIDVYTIHAFILNEEQDNLPDIDTWGAGIPPGYEGTITATLAVTITAPFTKTYDVNTFSAWVRDFRQWMADNGEQDKPLWITEFGSLFPPIDPPGGPDLANVSDQDTLDYMKATFNFLLGEKDPTIGYPGDENRLVQRFYWYSLNEYRYRFGGSLFDPETRARTIVGDAFVSYNPTGLVTPVDPDVQPIGSVVTPMRYTAGSNNTKVDYRVDVAIRNNISSDLFTDVSVELFEGSTSLGTASGSVMRCSGTSILTIIWQNATPGIQHSLQAVVSVDPGSGIDQNLGNNTWNFTITPGEPTEMFLPFTSR